MLFFGFAGIKQQCCFCCVGDTRKFLNNPAAVDDMTATYVLPDYHGIPKGYLFNPSSLSQTQTSAVTASSATPGEVNTSENESAGGTPPAHGAAEELPANAQTLQLSTERVSIPELLFHPSDVHIKQGGVAHTIFDSIRQLEKVPTLEKGLGDALYDNVVLTGGNSLFPGYKEKLEVQLRVRSWLLNFVLTWLRMLPIAGLFCCGSKGCLCLDKKFFCLAEGLRSSWAVCARDDVGPSHHNGLERPSQLDPRPGNQLSRGWRPRARRHPRGIF